MGGKYKVLFNITAISGIDVYADNPQQAIKLAEAEFQRISDMDENLDISGLEGEPYAIIDPNDDAYDIEP